MAGGFGRSELTFSLVLTAAMLTESWTQWKGIFRKCVFVRVNDGYSPDFRRARPESKMIFLMLIAIGN
jgi:hypothetical protein